MIASARIGKFSPNFLKTFDVIAHHPNLHQAPPHYFL
jgi:hypothetical protein